MRVRPWDAGRMPAEWFRQVLESLRELRDWGEAAWGVTPFTGSNAWRRDAKYRTHALEALAELDTALPYGVVQGSEPPDHMVDWSISEEAGLYEILHYEPAEEEREGLSLVQQEVKKKWLKPADGGRRRRRRTKPSGKSKGGRPREPTTPPRTPQLADQGPKVVHRPRPGSRCEVPPESTGAGSSTDAPGAQHWSADAG